MLGKSLGRSEVELVNGAERVCYKGGENCVNIPALGRYVLKNAVLWVKIAAAVIAQAAEHLRL